MAIKFKFTTRTLNASKPLNIEYVCSKCRKDVSVVRLIEVNESQITYPGGGSSSLDAELEYGAVKGVRDRMNKIFEEYEVGRYDAAKFNIKCPRCSKKEPWSKLSPPRLRWLPILPAILFGALGILGIFLGDFIVVIVNILLCGINVGFYYLIKFLYRKFRYFQIARLPKECLPKISVKND